MDLKEEAIKVVLSAMAKASIEKFVRRLSNKSPQQISPALVQERLCAHALSISSVKTLLSTESLVPISEFYCVPSVKTGKRRFAANQSKDFREDHILIEGVAGQGKSILLRYLCANSILTGGKVAVYYELRRLDHLKTLAATVFDSLKQFGLPGNSEALKSLSVERDVELYLDGFDELSQKDSEKVDRDLNYFSTNFPFVKVFVSARPHVRLALNATLNAYRIENLDKSDAFRLINKLLSREPILASELREKLEAHQGRVTELLETPLLVTLLVAKYTQTQQIPGQLSEFYGSIFQTLFEKHDNFKLPFRRRKRLSITALAYERAFEQFCFGALFVEPLTSERAGELAQWAMTARHIEGDSMGLLSDISDISSLINDDNNLWSFIHNSVQEFYAAHWLLSGSDEELKRHSGLLTRVQNAATRDQIFRFACELDEYRYKKFMELPFYERMTSPLQDGHQDALSEEACKKWLVQHARDIVFDKNRVDTGHFFSIYTDCVDDTPIRLIAPNAIYERVRDLIHSNATDEAISLLFELAVVRERLFAEAAKRIKPLLEKLNGSRASVSALADERATNDRVFTELLNGTLA